MEYHDETRGGSPEVLVTLGLGGWVSLGPYVFLDIEKILYFCVFIDFWHNLGTRIGQINICTMWESANPQSAL